MPWKGVGFTPTGQARRASPGLEQEPDSEMGGSGWTCGKDADKETGTTVPATC